MTTRFAVSSVVAVLVVGHLSSAPSRAVEATPQSVRFATFNASLNRGAAAALIKDLTTPDNVQARNVAEIIQRVAPDVLLINEFDFDSSGKAAALFQENYLGRPQRGAQAIVYPFRYSADVNTGVPSGFDLDRDGQAVTKPGTPGFGNDALGFGQFAGQYGMVLYSKYPIDATAVRQFREVLWKDVPGALLPVKPDGTPWYALEALGVLRLSSKSHWDVPVRLGDRVVHVLASHPTPPAFDGPEDRNGRRNHDEIRLWADYLSGGKSSAYLGTGELRPPDSFVVLGDLNADPLDGGSVAGAINQLLKHPKVNARFIPRSEGGAEASKIDGGANVGHRGKPENDTADFGDDIVGNLRVDYVLPSIDLAVKGGGVFWPASSDPLSRLVRMSPVASSDHRLVYLDVELAPRP
jgi:3-phytase